jgi:hypothetical protein
LTNGLPNQGVFTYVLDGLGAKNLQFEELFDLESLPGIR